MARRIPGVSGPARTGFAVLHPFRTSAGRPDAIGFSRWIVSANPWILSAIVLLILLWPVLGAAQAAQTGIDGPFRTLLRWVRFIVLQGFVFTVLISFLTMALGTALGVFLGLGQLSRLRPVAVVSYLLTQIFRNSPWLVLLFIVMLSFPFEIEIGGAVIPVPDWMKAVIGLALPIMANISEIVRGAVNSVPTGQWEAAESLSFTRRQTLFQIILPQCFKRMIPPWMNWYAILTMATPIVSILGVEEVLNLTRQAIEAENNRPELLVPFYGFVLLIFFAYCYPIARWTVRLERRYAVKL